MTEKKNNLNLYSQQKGYQASQSGIKSFIYFLYQVNYFDNHCHLQLEFVTRRFILISDV